MIYGRRSDQELKYAKAKAKATEFFVDSSTLPKFKLDSDDLHYSSVLVLTTYLEARLKGSSGEDYLSDLKKSASFYDAASNNGQSKAFSDGYWMLAMATYFLLGNYGSALVSAKNINNPSYYGTKAELLHRFVMSILEPSRDIPPELTKLHSYLRGLDIDEANVVDEARSLVSEANPEDELFSRIIYIAVLDTVASSARTLLPIYSNLSIDSWKHYFLSDKAPKVLWQAQRKIGESKVFAGHDAFIQLPTGSGKTKSIELLLRARYLADECNLAVVVAPLRALCSEIARDLSRTLNDIAIVNLASDVLEIDSWLNEGIRDFQVMVFTPEKLGYVIHHNPELLNDTNLFVFDEAHLLDSESRGPSYELLLTEIFRTNLVAQKVMISAVVSNAAEIAKWAFGDSEKIVESKDIQVSEKSIGLIQQNGHKVSYVNPNEISNEDYFLMVDLEPRPLKLLGRERKKRVFPDLANNTERKRDLAVYYANRLLPNGACAIYVPKKSSLPPLFKRLTELVQRDAGISNLQESISDREKQRFSNLVRMHYGGNSWLASGIEAGVLPHYGDLQGSLRQAVEYSIEHGQAKCIACTSTLAEGVNLPIKYLLITGAKKGLEAPKTRDFQNLIGRTARSGKYSEGSILLTDSLTDRSTKAMYTSLMKESDTEECKSAILNLLSDETGYVDGTTRTLDGDRLVNVILKNIKDHQLEYELADAYKKAFKCDGVRATTFAARRIRPLEAIESYLSGVIAASDGEINIEELCSATFAYASSDDATRKRLLSLFKAVYNSIRELSTDQASLYHLMQIGARDASSLVEWLESGEGINFVNSGCLNLRALTKQFIAPNPEISSPFDYEQLATLVELWIEGLNLAEIADNLNSRYSFDPKLSIPKVEKLASSVVKFSLSHFISCIIDAVKQQPELTTETNLDNLSVLLRKVKYGVASLREATICEEVLDDRMVAKSIIAIIGSEGPSDIDFLKIESLEKESELEQLANSLPVFCALRVRRLIAK